MTRPAEGTTLAGGRYTFVRHLGSGGMASVWLARDETLHREVAIKLMADTLADDDRWLARFKREARAAAALSHQHIVKVFDFGIEEHRPYLVMAHVSGGSLRDRIRDGGELPDASGWPASCCRHSRTCTRPGSSTATSSPATSCSTSTTARS